MLVFHKPNLESRQTISYDFKVDTHPIIVLSGPTDRGRPQSESGLVGALLAKNLQLN